MKRLREEIHSTPKEEGAPRIADISLINLQAKLDKKFDQKIYD